MRAQVLERFAGVLRREVVTDRKQVAAVGAGAVVACLTLAAYARIPLPFTPVPITLQTFFVLVAGAGLGPQLGTVALSAYLVLGTLGLPLFTGAWLGPTTGYLVGFVAAGWLVGTLVRRSASASTPRIVVAMAAGTLVIYVFGAAWLAVLTGDVRTALVAGVLPFLPGDVVKLAAAAAFCRGYRERLRALFP
ncbi:MAG: biotin transporter BioY [Candidatus Brocadiia bacterium]